MKARNLKPYGILKMKNGLVNFTYKVHHLPLSTNKMDLGNTERLFRRGFLYETIRMMLRSVLNVNRRRTFNTIVIRVLQTRTLATRPFHLAHEFVDQKYTKYIELEFTSAVYVAPDNCLRN
jgi:hypothetical protein